MTNPLWVVKTRMYTTSRSGETAYRNTLGTSIVTNAHEEVAENTYHGQMA